MNTMDAKMKEAMDLVGTLIARMQNMEDRVQKWEDTFKQNDLLDRVKALEDKVG